MASGAVIVLAILGVGAAVVGLVGLVGLAVLAARQRERLEAGYAQVCRDHALEPTDVPLGTSDAWLSQFDLLPRGDRDHSAVWGMQGPIELALGGTEVATTCAAFEWWWEDRQTSSDGKGNRQVRWVRRSCLAALVRLFDADVQHQMLDRFDGTASELAGDLALVVADAPRSLGLSAWGGARRGGPGGLASLFSRAGVRVRTDPAIVQALPAMRLRAQALPEAMRAGIEASWSGVDVQLQRRHGRGGP